MDRRNSQPAPQERTPQPEALTRDFHIERSRQFPLGAALVAGAHFVNDAVTSMLPALLPLLAVRFDLATSELALLVSVFVVSTSLPQPFFGSLADRLGGHIVGPLGLAVSAVLLFTLSAVSSVSWLGALLAIGGLGSAALHPAGMTLSRAASKANPVLAAALFTAAGMAGGASGPLLALGITSNWGFQALAWTAVPTLITAVVLFRFAPRNAASVIHGDAPSLPRFHFLRGPVGRLAFVALCANLAVLTFMSAMPVWLLRERSLAENSPILGLTLTTFSLAAAAGGMLGGTLARWISTNRLVVGSLALSIVALETVLIATPGSALYFIAVATAGALVFVHAPVITVRAQELSGGSESSVAGMLLGGTSAAAGFVYAFLGPAQSAFGARPVMAVVFLALIPAARIAATVFSAPKGVPDEGRAVLALASCSCPS